MGTLIKAKSPERADLKSLGSYLRVARLQQVLSQAELAARSGLSQTQISYFEAEAPAIAGPTSPHCAGP